MIWKITQVNLTDAPPKTKAALVGLYNDNKVTIELAIISGETKHKIVHFSKIVSGLTVETPSKDDLITTYQAKYSKIFEKINHSSYATVLKKKV